MNDNGRGQLPRKHYEIEEISFASYIKPKKKICWICTWVCGIEAVIGFIPRSVPMSQRSLLPNERNSDENWLQKVLEVFSNLISPAHAISDASDRLKIVRYFAMLRYLRGSTGRPAL